MDHVAKCANCRKDLTYDDIRFSKTDDVVCSDECAAKLWQEIRNHLTDDDGIW
jgi:hypothetical protein